MENNQEILKTNEEWQKIQQELESEKFKSSYSEELLEKKINENVQLEKEITNLLKQTEELVLNEQKMKELEVELRKNLKDEQDKKLINTKTNEDLEAAQAKLKQLEEQLKQQANSSEIEELAITKNKMNELMLANQQLREEAMKSQQSIGEVMLLAKEQATRMITNAEEEIQLSIEKARQEFFDIGNKANEIADEVKESQKNVNLTYQELLERITKLSTIDFGL